MLQAHIFIGMLAFVNPRPAVVLIPDPEPSPSALNVRLEYSLVTSVVTPVDLCHNQQDQMSVCVTLRHIFTKHRVYGLNLNRRRSFARDYSAGSEAVEGKRGSKHCITSSEGRTLTHRFKPLSSPLK